MTSVRDEDVHREGPPWRVSRIGVFLSLACLAALVTFSVLHAAEARRFALLAERAEPLWLLLALGFQVGTYVCAGAIWWRVAAAAGYALPRAHLARLSIEKLSVDQFLPTGGLSGNVVVINAMRRMGLPSSTATEALLIDVISHYAAFAGMAIVALFVLWLHHGVTAVIISLLGVFACLVGGIPLAISWLLRHRDWKPGAVLGRSPKLARLLQSLQKVSPARVWNPQLLGVAVALQVGTVLLDSATLWAALRAIGVSVSPLMTFVALVVATIAGLVSFLPGGVGTFEAGCTATLALLGVRVEAALTGTLLLRGLTLWLPLVPGLILARADLSAPMPRELADTDPNAAPSLNVSLDELQRRLRSGREGLTTAEATARLQATGANRVQAKADHGAFGELVRSISNPLALILLAAAGASTFLGEVANAAIITVMVILSAGINYWQSARSARAVRSLQAQVTPTASVLRDGSVQVIPRANVVVGDVIQLCAGDLVPADARLIESTDLHVQQAALTGESLPVEKQASQGPLTRSGPDAPELLFVGTSIVSGSASALVFATGQKTAFGDIAARLAERPAETEFERGSRRFGMLILQTVVFLVLFLLVVSIAMGKNPFQSLLFAVALAVGLTPEYLPMITTVTLSQGAARMAKHKVIVKHLASIQNLGSIDVLCSDKTGTLTSGEIHLDASLDPFGQQSQRPLFLANLNSTFETGVKSPLDSAILERRVDGNQGFRKVAEIPFDFERRRLSVVVEREGAPLLITKGAPESVFACCSSIELEGQSRIFEERDRDACLELFQKLCSEGYRVLAVAYRQVSDPGQLGPTAERDLVLAGFVTFADQLLEGVAPTITSLREDGVTIKILSGDNELVTRTLCQKVGIDTGRIVTGEQLDTLDQPALARIAEEASVFARVSPAQKHRIVMALKHQGHVVGFMGDGINDAPSLHGADVGISVSGAAAVAQEASDIVLLERRLEVLHAGIIAGRHSFANVLKYLLMGTSSNFGNMLSMAGAVFFLPFLPMLPTQILVNNFLYDLAQITIPTDNVDPAYLRGPQRWDIGVIRKFMLLIGPVSSIFDFVTFAVLLAAFHFGQAQFQTGWFVESLTTQVLVLFVIRTAGRPWTNRPSAPLALTTIGVVIIGLALPLTPLAQPLGMTPLPSGFFLFVLIVVPTYLALVEVVKRKVIGGVLQRAQRSGWRPS